MSKFSIRLIELRNGTGLTQAELARKLDMSRSTLGMYETAKREPDIETLERIADFFNVDMDYLLGNTNKTTMLIERKELPLNDSERSFLDSFRRLDDTDQARILERIEVLLEADKYKEKDTLRKTV